VTDCIRIFAIAGRKGKEGGIRKKKREIGISAYTHDMGRVPGEGGVGIGARVRYRGPARSSWGERSQKVIRGAHDAENGGKRET